MSTRTVCGFKVLLNAVDKLLRATRTAATHRRAPSLGSYKVGTIGFSAFAIKHSSEWVPEDGEESVDNGATRLSDIANLSNAEMAIENRTSLKILIAAAALCIGVLIASIIGDEPGSRRN